MSLDVAAERNPVIRDLLARRDELHRELERIGICLDVYGEAAQRTMPLAPPPPAGAIPSAPAKLHKYRAARARFATVIRGILVDNGEPLSGPDLLARYRQVVPNYPVEIHNFRRRMRNLRDQVRHIPDCGYWPADMPWHGRGGSEPPTPPRPRGRRRRVNNHAHAVAAGDDASEGTTALTLFAAPAAQALPVFGPLNHYRVLADDCGCAFCVAWRSRRDEVNAVPPSPRGHIYMSCSCVDCARLRRAHLRFQEEENRRTIWCEMSFHVVHNTDFIVPGHLRYCECDGCVESRLAAMQRIERELTNTEYSARWWVEEGNNYPMSYWFRRAVDGVTRGMQYVMPSVFKPAASGMAIAAA